MIDAQTGSCLIPLSMTTPWYRSRLFWFGLPGLLGLLWMWFGYLTKDTGICWGTQQTAYCFFWGGAEAFFFINPDLYPFLADSGYGYFNEPLSPEWETRIFAPAISLPKDWVGIDVGHWLLVTAYLIIWISALVIWQRRKCGFYQKVLITQTPDTP